MMPIYLVCGVPGSGKTWVCQQLADKFLYVPHDNYAVNDYAPQLWKMSKTSNKPIIAEAPFRISVLIQELSDNGIDVRPYFVLEPSAVVKARYEAREGKPIPKQHLTRVRTVEERAFEYRAPSGSSQEVLEMLKKV